MATRKQILDNNNNEILPITDTDAVRNPQSIGGTLESRISNIEKAIEDSDLLVEQNSLTDQQRNTALANVSNQTTNSTTGKMGYKVLDGSKSFASQVTAENTIYEIRDVFDLGGTQETPVSVTLPANCTLKFNGGLIKNGNLNLDNTIIDGDARFDTSFSGTLKNQAFNVMWIDKSDWGDKVNVAQQYFDNLFSPAVEVSFNTPVSINNITNGNIDFKTDLTYNGEVTNLNAGITFNNISYCNININNIACKRSNIDFNTNRTSNFIGVKFINSTFNNIRFSTISNFNEGIRFCGTSGSSCSRNYLGFNSIYSCNIGIRIYQDTGGWSNGIKMLYGSIRTFSSDTFTQKYAIVIAGPGFDSNSYLPTPPQDSYNASSDISIENIGLSNYAYPIYVAGTVSGITITGCREEGVTGLFYGHNGSIIVGLNYIPCYNNVLEGSYTNNMSYMTVYNPASLKLHEINIGEEKTKIYDKTRWIDNDCVLFASSGQIHLATSSTSCYIGAIFDPSIIGFIESTKPSSSFCVALLDSSFNNITDTVYDNNPLEVTGFTYKESPKLFRSGSVNGILSLSPLLKKNCNYVFIGKQIANIDSNETIRVYINATKKINHITKHGDTASRPTNGLPVIDSYFDETLGKPIWYNGTNWIDAAGATV